MSLAKDDKLLLSAFGAYIRSLRKLSGLRQQDVQESLHDMGFKTSIRDLYGWEHGVARPSSPAKAALIKILDGSPVEADELLLLDMRQAPLVEAAIQAGDRGQAQQMVHAHTALGAEKTKAWVRLRSQRAAPDVRRQVPAELLQEAQALVLQLAMHDLALFDAFLHYGRFLMSDSAALGNHAKQ